MQNIRTNRRSWVVMAIAVAAVGCATANPIDRLRKELAPFPEYSVVLEDMKSSGNFLTEYHHQYKVVYAEKETGSDDLIFHDRISDWVRVDRKTYEKYQPYLGMTILSKSADGKLEEGQFPPHYQYVGNQRYGHWVGDNRGNSFWEFYGKYAMLSHLFGAFSRPVYRSDWDEYRSYRRSGRPYFGSGGHYGTNGSYTKSTHRSFYQRQATREQARRQSFSRKVESRTRRSSMSGYRSRSSSSRGGK